jgi:hypothetical protein
VAHCILHVEDSADLHLSCAVWWVLHESVRKDPYDWVICAVGMLLAACCNWLVLFLPSSESLRCLNIIWAVECQRLHLQCRQYELGWLVTDSIAEIRLGRRPTRYEPWIRDPGNRQWW